MPLLNLYVSGLASLLYTTILIYAAANSIPINSSDDLATNTQLVHTYQASRISHIQVGHPSIHPLISRHAYPLLATLAYPLFYVRTLVLL